MNAQQAIARSAKFISLANAKSRAAREPSFIRVVMGCDGRFWVPATPRDESILVRAGYETI